MSNMNRPLQPMPTGVGKFASLDRRQAVLESIRGKFGADVSTQSTLRLEQRLGATAERIVFPVINDQGAQLDTEIRLARPDSFTITDWGFYLGLVPIVADPATPATQGADALYTGPNPATITAGLTAALFNAFHSGRLNMQMDTVQFLESMDLRRSRAVGTAQEGLATIAAAFYSADAWTQEQGITPMLPSQTLSGAMKLDVTVNLPRNLDLSGITTHYLSAVLVFHGYLNQGGAEFRGA